MTDWKLVPVEPTDEMLVAVRRYAAMFDWQGTEDFACGVWSVYLDAAPQPPTQPPQWPDARTMSEAPRDKPVLVWWPAEKQWAVSSWLETRPRWARLGHDTTTSPQPTHWLPMPQEPTTETTK